MKKVELAEKKMNAIDLKSMEPGGTDYFTAADVKVNPGEVLGKVCGIYQKVRPFLELVSDLFFVPKKWRDSLDKYIALMDQICPGA
jgi:hypothetical protein